MISETFSEVLELRDGRAVTLRPITQADAPALMELHSRLSPDTQYLRFFGPKPELPADEAEYLAGVDFDTRYAVVASCEEAGVGRVVAVGRFDVKDRDSAEFAIVVRDDFQRQGVGTGIVRRLMQLARERGIQFIAGEVLPENEGMLQLLRRFGLPIDVGPDDDVFRVAIPVDQAPSPGQAS